MENIPILILQKYKYDQTVLEFSKYRMLLTFATNF